MILDRRRLSHQEINQAITSFRKLSTKRDLTKDGQTMHKTTFSDTDHAICLYHHWWSQNGYFLSGIDISWQTLWDHGHHSLLRHSLVLLARPLSAGFGTIMVSHRDSNCTQIVSTSTMTCTAGQAFPDSTSTGSGISYANSLLFSQSFQPTSGLVSSMAWNSMRSGWY